MKIVFFGSTAFSVYILDQVLQQGYQVPLVVTGPDPYAGRGLRKSLSPVKRYATEQGIRTLQPSELEDINFINELKAQQADVFLVVAFKVLPPCVWQLVPTFNLHTSLLPNYRGAAPIERAIMQGERQTGVTTFFLSERVDAGSIIQQEKIAISEADDAITLTATMAEVGSKIVIKTLEQMRVGECRPWPQESNPMRLDMKYAPKITKKDLQIDWQRSTRDIHNQIRALAAKHGAHTRIKHQLFKIFAATYRLDPSIQLKPGTASREAKNVLSVAASDGYILPILVQPQNKQRMPISAFLNGARLDYPLMLGEYTDE